MTVYSKRAEDWRQVPREHQTPEQRAKSDEDAASLLAGFDAQFKAGLKASRAEDAGAPKHHDVSKGEYVRDVDPKKADDFLDD
jgi:hypothetical protein